MRHLKKICEVKLRSEMSHWPKISHRYGQQPSAVPYPLPKMWKTSAFSNSYPHPPFLKIYVHFFVIKRQWRAQIKSSLKSRHQVLFMTLILHKQTFKKEEYGIFLMSVFCIPLPPSKVLTYFMDIQKLLDIFNVLVITYISIIFDFFQSWSVETKIRN